MYYIVSECTWVNMDELANIKSVTQFVFEEIPGILLLRFIIEFVVYNIHYQPQTTGHSQNKMTKVKSYYIIHLCLILVRNPQALKVKL